MGYFGPGSFGGLVSHVWPQGKPPPYHRTPPHSMLAMGGGAGEGVLSSQGERALSDDAPANAPTLAATPPYILFTSMYLNFTCFIPGFYRGRRLPLAMYICL